MNSLTSSSPLSPSSSPLSSSSSLSSSPPPSSTHYEKMSWEVLKKRPIFSTIAAGLTIVPLLYAAGVIKEVPCGNGVINSLNRSFVHLTPAHILSNLFAFYVLSRIEVVHGSRVFISLIVQLLVINSLMEMILMQAAKIPCSIGFSGVLFGLAVWEIMHDHYWSLPLMLAIASAIAGPSIGNPRASLIGHVLGALSGFVVATYYKGNR